MKVFDDIKRTETRSKGEAEPHFAYLNYSARIEAERLRSLIEEWVTLFPEQHFKSWLTRFRSKLLEQHLSAFFELLVAKIYEVSGFSILEFDPNINNLTPDLLLQSPTGEKFYIECKVRLGGGSFFNEKSHIHSLVLDSINKYPNKKYWINYKVLKAGGEQPSGKKLAQKINCWLDGLNYEDVCNAHDYRAFNKVFTEKGWDIKAIAIPKSSIDNLSSDSTLVGMRSRGAFWDNSTTKIKDEIKKKTTKYKNLNYPLVIAISSHEIMSMYTCAQNVCFGDFGITEGEDLLQQNGIFGREEKPKNKNLAGVLIFNECSAWNFPSRNIVGSINPWINFDKFGWHPDMPMIKLFKNTVTKTEPFLVGSIFGLSKDFPESET